MRYIVPLCAAFAAMMAVAVFIHGVAGNTSLVQFVTWGVASGVGGGVHHLTHFLMAR